MKRLMFLLVQFVLAFAFMLHPTIIFINKKAEEKISPINDNLTLQVVNQSKIDIHLKKPLYLSYNNVVQVNRTLNELYKNKVNLTRGNMMPVKMNNTLDVVNENTLNLTMTNAFNNSNIIDNEYNSVRLKIQRNDTSISATNLLTSINSRILTINEDRKVIVKRSDVQNFNGNIASQTNQEFNGDIDKQTNIDNSKVTNVINNITINNGRGGRHRKNRNKNKNKLRNRNNRLRNKNKKLKQKIKKKQNKLNLIDSNKGNKINNSNTGNKLNNNGAYNPYRNGAYNPYRNGAYNPYRNGAYNPYRPYRSVYNRYNNIAYNRYSHNTAYHGKK